MKCLFAQMLHHRIHVIDFWLTVKKDGIVLTGHFIQINAHCIYL